MTPEVHQLRPNVRIHGVTSVLGYLHPIETLGNLLAAVYRRSTPTGSGITRCRPNTGSMTTASGLFYNPPAAYLKPHTHGYTHKHTGFPNRCIKSGFSGPNVRPRVCPWSCLY